MTTLEKVPPTVHTSARDNNVDKKKKPLRFKIGIGLLILYPIMLLSAAVIPFLPLEVGVKAAVIGGILASAEGILLVAIACVGKEAFQAIKARFLKRKKKDKISDEGTVNPEVREG